MQPDSLILELQNKNSKAFEELYLLYSESIFGVIHAIIGNKELSEEILQDVFIKVWENSEKYSPEKGRFFTWLLNIARNASIDMMRSKDFKEARQNYSTHFYVDIIEDKTNFSSKVDAIGIKKYIKSLKPVCIKILDLLYFKGYTQKETAENLKLPLGTIKTKNRNCLNSLRQKLNEQ